MLDICIIKGNSYLKKYLSWKPGKDFSKDFVVYMSALIVLRISWEKGLKLNDLPYYKYV